MGIDAKKKWTALSFLVIPLIYFAIFKIYPMAYNIFLSFTRYKMVGKPQWVGLSNYIAELQTEVFWAAVRNTSIYGVGAVILILVFSLGFAILLDRRIFGIAFIRMLIYVPAVLSLVVVSFLWMWIYNPHAGLLNFILAQLGIKPLLWLENPNLALICIIIVTVWQQLGYNMIIFLAGLQGIPDTLYEAARIDGAGIWAQFWHVTIPGLQPVTLFIVVTVFIFTFRNFAIVFTMTRGGPLNTTVTLVYEVYERTFNYYRAGEGAVYAVFLLAICLIFSIIVLRVLKTES